MLILLFVKGCTLENIRHLSPNIYLRNIILILSAECFCSSRSQLLKEDEVWHCMGMAI